MTPDDNRDDEYFASEPRGRLATLADLAWCAVDVTWLVVFVAVVVVLVMLVVTHQ